MLLTEYEGKRLFRHFGIPVPAGRLVTQVDEAIAIELPAMLKAQVRIGGRGKAGGVRRVQTSREAHDAMASMLGAEVRGEKTESLLVEAAVEIDQEFYLSITVDRNSRGPILLASRFGGVEIETQALDAMLRMPVDYHLGPRPYMVGRLLACFDMAPERRAEVAAVVDGLWRCFIAWQCEMVEINPLVLTRTGELIAVDAKVLLDDRSPVRPTEPQLTLPQSGFHGPGAGAGDPPPGVVSVRMKGDVLVVGGGAGTLMASMDCVAALGATLAGGIDLGGFTLRNPDNLAKVLASAATFGAKTLLFNTSYLNVARGDEVASVIREHALRHFPARRVVVRLGGNRCEEGHAILRDAGVRSTSSLEHACRWAALESE